TRKSVLWNPPPHPNPLRPRGRRGSCRRAANFPLRPSGGRGRGPTGDRGEGEVGLAAPTERKVRARAYLQVQQGCDHRCTFCIIPYARGPSRSVPLGALVAEARALLAAGYREIVLTGVDLTAYGSDLPGRPSLRQIGRRLLAGGAD